MNRCGVCHNFEIDHIKVFVDITLSTFNYDNASHGLSGVNRQQTLLMGHVPASAWYGCIQEIPNLYILGVLAASGKSKRILILFFTDVSKCTLQLQ